VLPGGARVPPASTATTPAVRPVAKPRHQDPAALQGALDGFQAAFAKAAEEPTPAPARPPTPLRSTAPDGRRGGLSRRVPGTNMASGLRKPVAGELPARMKSNWKPRDPAEDRAKLDSFASGIAHAASTPPTMWPTKEHLSAEMDAVKDTEKPQGTNR
jgi:hypothetical protein